MLYQNDDSGRDYFKGLKDGLGAAADKMLTSVATYEVTDPTIDSQIVTLQQSGADAFFMTGVPKFNAMAIRKAYDVELEAETVLHLLDRLLGRQWYQAGGARAGDWRDHCKPTPKDPTDTQWANDPAFLAWRAWIDKYYPGADLTDAGNVYGYSTAQTLVQTLKQCGDDLSRENIMKQALNLDLELPMAQPGIRVKTSPTDGYPLKQMRLVRFDGAAWVPFGEAMSG